MYIPWTHTCHVYTCIYTCTCKFSQRWWWVSPHLILLSNICVQFITTCTCTAWTCVRCDHVGCLKLSVSPVLVLECAECCVLWTCCSVLSSLYSTYIHIMYNTCTYTVYIHVHVHIHVQMYMCTNTHIHKEIHVCINRSTTFPLPLRYRSGTFKVHFRYSRSIVQVYTLEVLFRYSWSIHQDLYLWSLLLRWMQIYRLR